tara:strand:- start:1602 stop:2075 length:474 start_codon:yes stop_codon:yes gene_type:complete
MRFSNYDILKYSLNPDYKKSIKSHNGTLYKLDNYIYSYGEVIVDLQDITHPIIHCKTAKYKWYYSQTTSKHVGYMIQYCILHNIPHTLYHPHYTKKKKIDNFKIVKINHDTAQKCPITLLNYTEGYKTICNHEFSTKPLIKWLNDNYNCPLCRASLI